MTELQANLAKILLSGGFTNQVATPEHKLVADLGLDSLDMVEFTMSLESEYEIEIPDEQVELWVTVNDAAVSVQAMLNQKTAKVA